MLNLKGNCCKLICFQAFTMEPTPDRDLPIFNRSALLVNAPEMPSQQFQSRRPTVGLFRCFAQCLQQFLLFVESVLLFRNQFFLRGTFFAQLLHELLHGLELFTESQARVSTLQCESRDHLRIGSEQVFERIQLVALSIEFSLLLLQESLVLLHHLRALLLFELLHNLHALLCAGA